MVLPGHSPRVRSCCDRMWDRPGDPSCAAIRGGSPDLFTERGRSCERRRPRPVVRSRQWHVRPHTAEFGPSNRPDFWTDGDRHASPRAISWPEWGLDWRRSRVGTVRSRWTGPCVLLRDACLPGQQSLDLDRACLLGWRSNSVKYHDGRRAACATMPGVAITRSTRMSGGAHRKPVLEAGHHHLACPIDDANDVIEGRVTAAQRLRDVAVDVAHDGWLGVRQARPSLLIGGSCFETAGRSDRCVERPGHHPVVDSSFRRALFRSRQLEASRVAPGNATGHDQRVERGANQGARAHSAAAPLTG